MIFKLVFDDRKEYVQAKSFTHLKDSYNEEYEDEFEHVETVSIVSEKEAKTIMLKSNEPELIKEFSLFDASSGDDFMIIGTNEPE